MTTTYPETTRTIESALPADRAELRAIGRRMMADGYTDTFIADRLCDILDDAEGVATTWAPAQRSGL